jgi:hypothetical protein
MGTDKILERSANVLLILCSCLVVTDLVWRHVQPVRAVQPKRRPVDLRGASVAGVRPSPDSGGVILFVAPDCPYCEASLSFYHHLADAARAAGLSTLVAVTERGRPADGGAYVRARSLDATPIDPTGLIQLGLRGTPILLVYDAEGRVTGDWLGRLKPPDERMVEAILTSVAGARARAP